MSSLRVLAFALVSFSLSVAFGDDQETAPLKQQLDSGNLNDKTRAARMLGEIGPAAADAVSLLVKSLSNANPQLRHEVVVALGRINTDPKEVIPALNRILSDPIPAIRLSAIDALRKFGSEAQESLVPLKGLLDDKEPLISVGAARAIVEIGMGKGVRDPRANSVLISGLKSDRQDVSTEAIHGLAVSGPESVPAIVELISGSSLNASINACNALASIGPGAAAAVDPLLSAAKSADTKLRSHAIVALGDIGPAAKSAVPVLIEALVDPDSHIRFSAEQSLHKIGKSAVPALIENLKKEQLQPVITRLFAEIGSDAEQAVPALAELLSTKNAETKREVILALAGIGPAANSTAAPLIKILEDKAFAYRPAAAFALGKMGAKAAIPALKESLTTPDSPGLRLASVWALLQLEPSNQEYVTLALPQLAAALENDKPEFRREAAKALGRIGAPAKVSVAALLKCLGDKSHEVRRESLIALAEIGPESKVAVAEILRTLIEGDSTMRPIACYALGRIGKEAKPALPALRRLLFSRDVHEKTLAAWAMVSISPEPDIVKESIPLLTAALIRSENPEARAELAKTLGKIGSNSDEVKDALKMALKDSDESVRKAAELALGQLK